MDKVLAAYKLDPTKSNFDKLARYIARHPMAVMFVSAEDAAILYQTGLVRRSTMPGGSR